MKKNFLVILFLSLVCNSLVSGQNGPKEKGLETITLGAIKGQLEFLASDWTEGRATMSTKFEAPVVFVGYGIVNKEKGIDDFAGIDVRGRVILRLTGFPGYSDQNSAMYKKLVGDNPRASFELMRNKNAWELADCSW